MSWNTNVRVIQSKPASWFSCVEKVVYRAGYWIECDGEHKLTITGSGVSGMLRFKNPQGDYVLVALGVHNNKRWCDIVPDLTASNTGVEINPTYYSDAPGNRNGMPWKQLAHYEHDYEVTTTKGVKVIVDYYEKKGTTLYATITFA